VGPSPGKRFGGKKGQRIGALERGVHRGLELLVEGWGNGSRWPWDVLQHGDISIGHKGVGGIKIRGDGSGAERRITAGVSFREGQGGIDLFFWTPVRIQGSRRRGSGEKCSSIE